MSELGFSHKLLLNSCCFFNNTSMEWKSEKYLAIKIPFHNYPRIPFPSRFRDARTLSSENGFRTDSWAHLMWFQTVSNAVRIFAAKMCVGLDGNGVKCSKLLFALSWRLCKVFQFSFYFNPKKFLASKHGSENFIPMDFWASEEFKYFINDVSESDRIVLLRNKASI